MQEWPRGGGVLQNHGGKQDLVQGLSVGEKQIVVEISLGHLLAVNQRDMTQVLKKKNNRYQKPYCKYQLSSLLLL